MLSALLALMGACSLRELGLPDEKGMTVMIRIGTAASSRSSFFDSGKESSLGCFVLAAYRGGFLAYTLYYDSEEGDFEASADVNLPALVNPGYPYTFYIIANAGDTSAECPFPPYEKDVPGMILRPGRTDGYIPMAGKGYLDMPSGTARVELKRLVAKINCNVTLPCGAVLDEARLCQTPLSARPFGDGYAAGPGEVRDGDSFAFSTVDNSGYQSGPSGTEGYTLSSEALYVLENMQGEEPGNTDVWRKFPSDDSRAESATYINMHVTFPDGPVEMRFYLGADALCDYNLERNNSYTMNLSIWNSDATKSGWSMVDLRCTDNWPGGDFLAGQVRSISFRSPDVRLVLEEGSEDVIGLDTDGLGKWYISGLGAGEAAIDVVAENIVRWTIPVSVHAWSGTAGALQLGLHGNAAAFFQEGVKVGDRTFRVSDAPVMSMPDDASLFCADVLRTILYGADGGSLPVFGPCGSLPGGVVECVSADPSFPNRPDSLFVTDPSDWESRYGAGRLFENAFSLSAGDISLDIPVRISNVLCTPDRDSVKMIFHDWSLSSVRGNDISCLSWTPYAQDAGGPVPDSALVRVFSVPVTDTLDSNSAVSYLYSSCNSAFSIVATLSDSRTLSHTVGLVEVYADVRNSRSGAVYRTALFKEENYLHLCCGAVRSYRGKGMTGGHGRYNYEAERVAVYVELSARMHVPNNRNHAAEELFYAPGVVSFTGETFILFPWAGSGEAALAGYPYWYVARQQRDGGGSLAEVVYYDYFWENSQTDWNEVKELYLLSSSPSLADTPAAYDIDTEKTSRLFGGWLVVHKYEEIDGSTHGWVNEGGVTFPDNMH